MEVKGAYMNDCPFCGHKISDISKSNTGWKEYTSLDGQVHRHYVKAAQENATPCWEINCSNCGANLVADSPEELLAKWNSPVRSEWADQEYTCDNIDVPPLDRCPLCDLDVMSCTDDSFHPTGRSWLMVGGAKVYFTHKDTEYLTGIPCYAVCCSTSAGGCGLNIEGESAQNAAEKWNVRVTRAVRNTTLG